MAHVLSAIDFYKAVQAAVRTEAGTRLPPLLRRWRYTQSSDHAELAVRPDSLRFLVRYGVLDGGKSADEQAGGYRKFIVQISRASGDAPGLAAKWIELFAAGEYGIMPAAFCAAEARCTACPLKETCRFLAAGATDSRSFGHSFAESLLAASGNSPADLRAADLLAFVMSGEKSGAAEIARAEALLKACNGLRGAFQSDPEMLRQAGLPESAVARLRAAAELCRLWADERGASGKIFMSGQDFFEHFHLRVRDLKQELFMAVLLDQKHRLIGEVQVSAGTLTEALVHPREVFSQAIAQRAAAIAVVHNHPTGDPAPSAADRAITRRLQDVAKLVGIRFLDHVVIGDGRYVSFVEQRLLG